ncbi:MAG: hypothetical protein KTR15_03315 [Phycisphaeraceae bacterium]|nr:hypothetical protein [Phycisphaeraceae bacterium]
MINCDPAEAILKHLVIPVFCVKCGSQTRLDSLSDSEKKSLVEMTSFQNALEERRMLIRIKQLFDRFPDSKHASIMCKLFPRDRRPGFEPDAAFDEALGNQPDIKKYLSKRSFLLPARLRAIEAQVVQYQNELSDYSIQCQKCFDLLAIDKEFFNQLN